jgi:Family of unknown function (DUF5670)
MLWALALIEVVLWIYGMGTHHKMGGVLHFLLALAAIAILTELALRWRDQRRVVVTTARAQRRPDIRKAA